MRVVGWAQDGRHLLVGEEQAYSSNLQLRAVILDAQSRGTQILTRLLGPSAGRDPGAGGHEFLAGSRRNA